LAVAASATLLVAAAATAQTSTTIVISPILGNQQASANQIVSALTAITDNSATKSYLIKIEPGIYDFGTQSLQMKPFIDIEGSGREVTTLTGLGHPTFFQATVIGASNAEIRQLTVESRGEGVHDEATAITLPQADTRVSDVTVIGRGGIIGSCGIAIQGGAPVIRDVEILADADGGGSALGIAIEFNSTAVVDSADIEARDGTNINTGILFQLQSSRTNVVTNSTIVASGGTTSTGVELRNNTNLKVRFRDVRITGIQASSANYGIHSRDQAALFLEDATIAAAGGTVSYGAFLRDTSSFRADHSVLAGGTASLDNTFNLPQARLGASQLSGTTVGNVRCAGAYDKNYIFFPSTCP